MDGDVFWVAEEEEEGVSMIGSDATCLGGHSLFSFVSSFAKSPAICDDTLELRGIADATEDDWRLVCCSKRPMRFATL
jgi:hypothetical protein